MPQNYHQNTERPVRGAIPALTMTTLLGCVGEAASSLLGLADVLYASPLHESDLRVLAPEEVLAMVLVDACWDTRGQDLSWHTCMLCHHMIHLGSSPLPPERLLAEVAAAAPDLESTLAFRRLVVHHRQGVPFVRAGQRTDRNGATFATWGLPAYSHINEEEQRGAHATELARYVD